MENPDNFFRGKSRQLKGKKVRINFINFRRAYLDQCSCEIFARSPKDKGKKF